jgi:hypothetical protein
MTAIGAIDPTTAQSAQAASAVQSGQTGSTVSTAQTDVQKLGLPPANLAAAAATNTMNAALVSSQWGIDPGAVGGVYGGAAADGGGLFAGDNLLPLLQTLTHANAEQALSLIGVQTPKPGTSGSGATTSAAAATSPAAQATAAAQYAVNATPTNSGPATIDPLWGTSA